MMELYFFHAGKDEILPEDKQITLGKFVRAFLKSDVKRDNQNFNTAPQNELSTNSL